MDGYPHRLGPIIQGVATTQKPVHEIPWTASKRPPGPNEHRPCHDVARTRFYKDEEQWKDSSSLGRESLPLVTKGVDQGHLWIFRPMAKVLNEMSTGSGANA